jgi:photosystem II stability/assembly factor-like uncharacterized protein
MLCVAMKDGIYFLWKGVGTSWHRRGPVLARKMIMAMATDADRRTVYVSIFREGVFRSSDYGQSWEDITSNLPYKDVRALAISPHDSNVIYAGTEPPGVFVSRNGGQTWTECGNLREHPNAREWSFPVPPRVPHVRTLEVSPRDPNTLYAGIEVGSFLISRDGGQTWEAASGIGRDIHRLIIHPAQPDRLIVATGDDTPPYRQVGGFGIYRSDDGGRSWRQANDGLDFRTYCEDAIAFHPKNPDLLFLAAADGIPPRWASMTKLAFGALSGNVYFLAPSRWRRRKGADVVIFRSRNGGDRWESIMNGLPSSFFDMIWALDSGLTEHGDVGVYFGTTGGEIYASEDEGESWRKIAEGLPGITHLKVLEA